jgi:hypothetical protein
MKFNIIQDYFYVGKIGDSLIIFGIMESCHQMRGVILNYDENLSGTFLAWPTLFDDAGTQKRAVCFYLYQK